MNDYLFTIGGIPTMIAYLPFVGMSEQLGLFGMIVVMALLFYFYLQSTNWLVQVCIGFLIVSCMWSLCITLTNAIFESKHGVTKRIMNNVLGGAFRLWKFGWIFIVATILYFFTDKRYPTNNIFIPMALYVAYVGLVIILGESQLISENSSFLPGAEVTDLAETVIVIYTLYKMITATSY